MEPIVYLNGKFVALADARVSILDRGFCYGDGLFETLRAYSGTIFRLDLHLDRLERGAQSIFLELPEPREKLEEILYLTLEKNKCPDAVIRLTVTRGEGLPGKLWQTDYSPTLSVHVRPHTAPPEEWYHSGVPVSLIPDSASKIGGLAGQIKSTNYLSQILARKQADHHQSVEGIMVNEQGEVCDGTISNIFLVKSGEVSTPAVNGYVLAGVTRQMVLELAAKRGTPAREKSISPEEILNADEVFLTNTGWELLPVTRIDGNTVGSGQPGPLTLALRQGFRKSVEAEIRK